MLTRRIIPCLDVRDGRVVKGVQFQRLRTVGDPVELAQRYAADGADELCLLDVSASIEARPPVLELVGRVAEQLFIPLTVGGGLRSVQQAREALRSGADKVALNSAALARPQLLRELASEFGSQCVVLSIDTKQTAEGYRVTTHSAGRTVAREALDWAQEAVSLGTGEILLNVIDSDGVRSGFSHGITDRIARHVTVPVIASGGAGSARHFADLFESTAASAALAASIFHDGSWTPDRLKHMLADRGIEVRP